MSANSSAMEPTEMSPADPSIQPTLTEPVASDFPARLRDDERIYRIGRRQFWCLFGLMLLTVLPRVLLAFRLDAVCDDAYYYISVADAWDRADIEAALQYLNINVYPLILWGLHAIGFDWIVGAQVWGIVISALTILPMYGLVRRLYDDRVALATCFLFAIHPELIESSIEPIRGPTFWFLFVLSLYVIWRTVHAGRIAWYFASGICIALAIHTRVEGWILFAPFCLWTVLLRQRRSDTMPVERRWGRLLKTAFGSSVVFALIPGFVALVNVTLLKDHTDWEWGRFTHFRNFYEWVRSDISKENIHVSDKKPRPWSVELTIPPKPTPPKKKTSGKTTVDEETLPAATVARNTRPQKNVRPPQKRVEITPAILAAANPPQGPPPEAISNPFTDGRGATYVKQFGRKFEPLNLVLMGIGLCGWWKVMFRRDKIVMLLVYFGLMLAIWIRLAQIGDMNGRYFLTPFLVALPIGGIGLLWTLNRLGRVVERIRESHPLRALAVPAGMLLLVAGFSVTDALTATHKQRRAQAKLGEWLNRELGPFESVLVDRAATRVGYFAHGTMPTVSYYFSSSGDGQEYAMPDLLIVTRKLSKPHERVFLQGQVMRMNLQPVNVDVIPGTSRGYLIFAKRQPRSKSHLPQFANREDASTRE